MRPVHHGGDAHHRDVRPLARAAEEETHRGDAHVLRAVPGGTHHGAAGGMVVIEFSVECLSEVL